MLPDDLEIDVYSSNGLAVLLAAAQAADPCAVARLAALERLILTEARCLLCDGDAVGASLIFVTRGACVSAHRICRYCLNGSYPEPLSDAICWRLTCQAVAGPRVQPMPWAAH
jgi:hypothetical protein